MRARSHAPPCSGERAEPASARSPDSEGLARPTIGVGKPAPPPAPALRPPSGKPERMPNASRSVREKLARVAKLRGG
jgi:hypothetical protein